MGDTASIQRETRLRTSRHLLILGVIVGPFYLGVGLIQALVRDGFDLGRHPLSVLANGPGGWVQTLNFLVSGLLVIAAAYAIGSALRPQSRSAGWILSAFGAGMLVASIFPADPIDGFPPGTPEGVPETVSTAGLIHFVAGALGFLALAISAFVVGRAQAKRGDRLWAWSSRVVGAVVILGFLIGPTLPPRAATAGIWVGVIAGFAWLAALSARLRNSQP